MRGTTGLLESHNVGQEMKGELVNTSWLSLVGRVMEMGKEKAMVVRQQVS